MGQGMTEKQDGFTIIETLIVMAVSALLFLMIAVTISGRQARTEFSIGVRDVQTKIQQVITDVNNGYYPTQSKFTCAYSGGNNLSIKQTNSGSEQGSNSRCIFVGKALVFDSDKMYIYSLAGLRLNNSGNEVSTPKEARITAIAQSPQNGDAPEATEIYQLPAGLKLFRASHDASSFGVSDVSRYGFAALSSLAGDGSVASQVVNIHGYGSPMSSGGDIQALAGTVNGEAGLTDPYPRRERVSLCFDSDGTNQSFVVTVGGSGGTSVTTDIKSGDRCGA